MTRADNEDRARFTVADVSDYAQLTQQFAASVDNKPLHRILSSAALSDTDRTRLQTAPTSPADQQAIVDALNRIINDPKLYNQEDFAMVRLSAVASDLLKSNQLRIKPVDRRRMNRTILEDTMPQLIQRHEWTRQHGNLQILSCYGAMRILLCCLLP